MSDASVCSPTANASSIRIDAETSLQNVLSARISSLAIVNKGPDSYESDMDEIDSTAISNEALKDSNSTDSSITTTQRLATPNYTISQNEQSTNQKDIADIMEGSSSTSHSSSLPKTTDALKGSVMSADSSNSLKDSSSALFSTPRRNRRLRSTSERNSRSPVKPIPTTVDSLVTESSRADGSAKKCASLMSQLSISSSDGSSKPIAFDDTSDSESSESNDSKRHERTVVPKSENRQKSGVRRRNDSLHNETTCPTTGPTPRKLRTRTPSVKCLEALNLEEQQISPLRRSNRRKTVNKKYVNHIASSKKRQSTGVNNQDPSDDPDDDYVTDEEAFKKSSMLCDHAADVADQPLFLFRTPKKRDAMAQLAASASKTPQTPGTPRRPRNLVANNLPITPKTPKSTFSHLETTSKTPRHVRSLVKHALNKCFNAKTSGSDFSADDSDGYQPDETAETDSDEYASSSCTESSGEDTEPEAARKYVPPIVSAVQTPRLTRSTARKQQDFVPESDGYFSHHTNKKTITSDRTLDRLKNPRLPQDHLFRLLATTTLSDAHELAITEINQEYRQHFAKWMFTLNEGYSVLLHGLGSKRNLLQLFHETVLFEQTVLVVNGFFPSLTIKDIVDHITGDLLDMSLSNRNLHEIVDAIEERMSANGDLHIFLIVHNIDGSTLRNHKAQLILSRLARIDRIHLIASMDHINAPLLWDHTKLCNYNFSWWDVTTFLPYTEETSFENSMLVNNSGGLALSSMKNVFLSLTLNSRGIFLIIVNNVIVNKGNANYQGMPFKDLYSRCREDFLVSSDVALRSQLTEFIDHNLVKMKRTLDGTEHLTIPLDHSLLQQFVEEQENI